MPGEISRAHKGPGNRSPYVPEWCYPNSNPKMCPCGHHEGYHNDAGICLLRRECNCQGLPDDCYTTSDEFNSSMEEE